MMKITVKRALSFLLCALMVLSTMSVGMPFTVSAANGDWIVVHSSQTETYNAFSAGTFYITDGNDHALINSSGTLSAGTLANASAWTFTSKSGGFTISNGTNYLRRSSGSLGSGNSGANNNVFTVTPVTDDTVYIQDNNGSYLSYSGSSWTLTTTPTDLTLYTDSGGYVYTIDNDGIDVGAKYLICGNNYKYIMRVNSSGDVASTAVTVTDGKITLDNDTNDWVFSSATSGSIKWDASDRYLRTNKTSIGTVTSAPSTNFTITGPVSGQAAGAYNLRFYYDKNNNALTVNSSGTYSYTTDKATSKYVWLYKYTGRENKTVYANPKTTTTTPDKWASLSTCAVTDYLGTTISAIDQAIRTNGDFAVSTGQNANGTSPTILSSNDPRITFDYSAVNVNAEGTYTVPVSYKEDANSNTVQLGTVSVTIEESPVVSVTLVDAEGNIYAGAAATDSTGAYVSVVHENNATELLPVTLDMLSGTFDRNAAGTYTGLTVTYGGMLVTSGFTLNVAEAAQITTGSNQYVRYTPKTSGQRVEAGDYIIYNGQENIILTTTNRSGGGISGSTNFTLSSNNTILTTSENVAYTIKVVNASGNLYTLQTPDGRYLNIKETSTTSISLSNTAENIYAKDSRGNNVLFTDAKTITCAFCSEWQNNYFTAWDSTEATINDTNCQTTLYKKQETTKYYVLSAANHTILVDHPFSQSDINSLASVYVKSSVSGAPTETLSLTDSRVSVNWVSGFNNSVPGEYPVEISVDGQLVGTFTVTVAEPKAVEKTTLLNKEGSVGIEAAPQSETGAYIELQYDDGSKSVVPVTLGMLSGNYNVEEVGTYEGLTLTYRNQVLTNEFTLYVVGKDDYPEYPEEGSVRVGKSGGASDFENNGVARVQLTVTGVPMMDGIDIVFVLDTSSSMRSNYMGTYNGQSVFGSGNAWYDENFQKVSSATNSNVTNQKTRAQILQENLELLVNGLTENGVNGVKRDVEVAICDFNGYTFINSKNDKLTNVNVLSTTENHAQVYTGSKKWDADAFVSAESLYNNVPTLVTDYSGTNYDRAMQQAYELTKAKKERNEANGKHRDQYVIFMSDGGAFQFNYFGGSSNQDTDKSWNRWLIGYWDNYTQVPTNSSHNYFYNGKGNKNRYAAAVAGSPDQTYAIINPSNATGSADVTGDGKADPYMENVNGLGATLYSIGYCICPDIDIDNDTILTTLKNCASTEAEYYTANSDAQLHAVFDSIVSTFKDAGTGAYFLDTMGASYDIQMARNYTKNGEEYTLDTAPSIEFISYDLYTREDLKNGVIDDYNQIGSRKGTNSVLERVTFSNDGTRAYSDRLGSNVNILEDGVINASRFFYNTNTDSVRIDTDADGTDDFELAAETFYWKVDIIEQYEFVLAYDVYLTGSMEGTRPKGIYATNESAVLYYTNYLEHPCHKDTVSPKLPWKSAQISYEFYLVDAQGYPVNSAGERVPFSNRVLVGNVQNKELLLNNIVTEDAKVSANNVIPEGYVLYSPDAQYQLKLDSGTTPSGAEIKDTKTIEDSDKYVTTYFYTSNDLYHENGTVPESKVESYGNTHVAFAVLLQPSIIPDAVVIDYGIPVQISALANDVCIPTGTTISAISVSADDITLFTQGYTESQFKSSAKELTLGHGLATVSGDKVIYKPTDAEMEEEDIFYYEVIINGKFYYSKITVYPAQNIYYEDDFFTFTPEESWLTAGTRKDAYQAEDRPGNFNLANIDFNNVYGYDAVYDDTTVTYSLGSARYARVNKDTPKSGASQPLASFTFRGTGFDLFSVTTNMSGSAKVRVYSGDELIDNFAVNTYYGYTYNSETDEFEPDTSAEGGLYQIPVIRARDYEYGTYRVEVAPWYTTVTDHQKRGYYDLYIDGIRIYDPADPNPSDTIKEVYKQDVEANSTYIELRSNIISANNFYALSTTPGALKGAAPGIMFIDSIAELSPGSYAEAYKKFTEVGPNNEIYLKQGQAIAFYLELGDIHDAPASIQLGMKVPGGNANGSVLLMNSAQEAPQKITVQGAAPRYYDITNAFSWNKDLLDVDNLRGLKAEDITAGQDSMAGEYTASEWTFIQSGSGWKLSSANGSNVVLARQESGLITASFAPNGTGDVFRAEAENGLFTFANSIGYSFGYNGVVTGVEYGGASFQVYSANGDGTYTRVKTAEDLVDGEKYLMVYTSAKTMLVSPSMATASATSKTYKTLYPVVIMNNGEGILSLTNLKVVFNDYDSAASLKSSVSSSAKMASFASMAAGAFATNPDYEDEAKIGIADITTEFVAGDKETGARGTLYIRTPGNIESVIVGDDEVTEYTRNGDGTRTFAYHFDVEYDPETAGYVITVKDADGNTDKLLKAGQLELVEILPEATDEPGTDEPGTGEEEGGFLRWLRFHVNLIIEFFKSIIRWVKSII